MSVVILVLVVLYAVTIHEFSHGMVAYKLGDNTAYHAGRLTLNPIRHLDPVGTLMLIFIHIGWARPVPVNAANFTNPKRDMMLVGIAGPSSNIVSAFIFGMIFRLMANTQPIYTQLSLVFMQFLAAAIIVNLGLAIFNIIPVFPLDGSHILKGLLPRHLAYRFSLYERYLTFLLLGIVFLGLFTRLSILDYIIWPPVNFFAKIFSGQSLFTLEEILKLH